MSYIEKDKDGEFFNDVSCTCEINPTSSSSSSYTNSDENKDRWYWLISGWNDMSFKERMALFFPYLHYVNVRNNIKAEFDDQFSTEMIETAYKTCRTFKELKFDPDGQGTPNLIMVYNPIDPKLIPDSTIKSKVIAWGAKYGFYEKEECPCFYGSDDLK